MDLRKLLLFLLFLLLPLASNSEVRVLRVPKTFFAFLASGLDSDPFATEEDDPTTKAIIRAKAGVVVPNPVPDLIQGLTLDVGAFFEDAGCVVKEESHCLYFPASEYLLISGGRELLSQVDEITGINHFPPRGIQCTLKVVKRTTEGDELVSELMVVCPPAHRCIVSSSQFTLEVEPTFTCWETYVEARFSLKGKGEFADLRAETSTKGVFDHPIGVMRWTQKPNEHYAASLTFSHQTIPVELTHSAHLNRLSEKAAALLKKRSGQANR